MAKTLEDAMIYYDILALYHGLYSVETSNMVLLSCGEIIRQFQAPIDYEKREADIKKSYQRQFKNCVEKEICKNGVLKYGRYKIYV